MGVKTSTTYTSSATPSWYSNAAQDLIANQANVSSRPYVPIDPATRVAGFNTTQNQGFDLTRAAANSYQPVLGSALAGVNNAAGRSSVTASQPTLDAAMAGLQGVEGRSSLTAASPFITAALDRSGFDPAYGALANAGRSSISDVNDYMNPYLNNVINRYGEIGARTLQEKLMPAVTNKYITAGQLGGPTRAGTGASGAPSAMYTDTARALRDVQESVGQQQMLALSQGYDSAVAASAADKARQATVGGTYANIATGNNQLMATLAGQVGQMYGQDTANRLTASGQLANIADQIARTYGQDTANQLLASGQLATIASQMQTQGLAGANAITGIGNQEQLLEQKNRDVATEERLRAAGFDQAQIDAMTRTLAGVSGAVPTGSVSVTQNKSPNSSMLGTVAGGALTYAGATGGRP